MVKRIGSVSGNIGIGLYWIGLDEIGWERDRNKNGSKIRERDRGIKQREAV
jgi:hypothetical protein